MNDQQFFRNQPSTQIKPTILVVLNSRIWDVVFAETVTTGAARDNNALRLAGCFKRVSCVIIQIGKEGDELVFCRNNKLNLQAYPHPSLQPHSTLLERLAKYQEAYSVPRENILYFDCDRENINVAQSAGFFTQLIIRSKEGYIPDEITKTTLLKSICPTHLLVLDLSLLKKKASTCDYSHFNEDEMERMVISETEGYFKEFTSLAVICTNQKEDSIISMRDNKLCLEEFYTFQVDSKLEKLKAYQEICDIPCKNIYFFDCNHENITAAQSAGFSAHLLDENDLSVSMDKKYQEIIQQEIRKEIFSEQLSLIPLLGS